MEESVADVTYSVFGETLNLAQLSASCGRMNGLERRATNLDEREQFSADRAGAGFCVGRARTL